MQRIAAVARSMVCAVAQVLGLRIAQTNRPSCHSTERRREEASAAMVEWVRVAYDCEPEEMPRYGMS
jgi:hypothetical protein